MLHFCKFCFLWSLMTQDVIYQCYLTSVPFRDTSHIKEGCLCNTLYYYYAGCSGSFFIWVMLVQRHSKAVTTEGTVKKGVVSNQTGGILTCDKHSIQGSCHSACIFNNTAPCVVLTLKLFSVAALALKDTIQNFQFWRVRLLIYSLNFSCMSSKRCRVLGTPVAGSCSWHRLWWSSKRKQKQLRYNVLSVCASSMHQQSDKRI